ncbi:MAG: hypothetical protein AAF532_02180 [Planctomycetota bacterium]
MKIRLLRDKRMQNPEYVHADRVAAMKRGEPYDVPRTTPKRKGDTFEHPTALAVQLIQIGDAEKAEDDEQPSPSKEPQTPASKKASA